LNQKHVLPVTVCHLDRLAFSRVSLGTNSCPRKMHPSFKFITFTLTATLLIQALFPLGIQAAKSGPTCYFPDGTSALEDEDEALLWEPCNQVVGSVGPCCQTNHTTWTTGAKPDVCQPNGLCSNWWYPDDGDPYVAWWAPICTDKDWNSPNCVKLPVDKCVSCFPQLMSCLLPC